MLGPVFFSQLTNFVLLKIMHLEHVSGYFSRKNSKKSRKTTGKILYEKGSLS